MYLPGFSKTSAHKYIVAMLSDDGVGLDTGDGAVHI